MSPLPLMVGLILNFQTTSSAVSAVSLLEQLLTIGLRRTALMWG